MHAFVHTVYCILYTVHSSRYKRGNKMRKETCIWCLVVFRVWREYEPTANRQTDQRNLFNISKTGYC